MAEETAEKEAEPADQAAVVAEETQEEEDPDEPSDMLAPTGTFSFDGTPETLSFTGSAEMDTVYLTNVLNKFANLSEWYLLVNEMSVTPVETTAGEQIPLSGDVFCQGAFIPENGGEAHMFANTSLIEVPSSEKLNLVISGISVISLAGRENSTIELDHSSGMLIGPENARLFFSGLNKLTIPALPAERPAAKNEPVTYAVPVRAPEEKEAFVFTASDGEVQTDEPVILVKTGYSLYGWNIAFENGMTMSLADVRTFQTKNRTLPDSSGVISYGDAKLTFKNAKRIRVYEKPSYCGYGKQPE